jgi:acetyltransferase-like isoleucine patch superfamily enzyme
MVIFRGDMIDISFLGSKIFNRLIYRPWLKRRLNNVGADFRIGRSSVIINPQFFTFGDFFYSGPFSYFGTNKNFPVEVGDYVMFGPGCVVQGGNHSMGYPGYMRLNPELDCVQGVIKVGNGAWIGARSVLISGADIGEGSVIGAMSLVNKAVPPFVVAAGVPARVIKSRFSELSGLKKALEETGSTYSLQGILDIHSSFGIRYQ